jgi:hypothetical protein
MTRKEIESVVRETLREEFGHGPRAAIEFHGSQSYKSLGRGVGDALIHAPVVIVVGRDVRSVAGRKPWWR